MVNLKARVLSLLFLFPLLMFSAVQADSCCEPKKCCEPKSCEQDWCGGWTIGVDALYWHPCVSDQHYAAVGSAALNPSSGSISFAALDPEWEPGVRVYLKKENIWECLNFCLAYTYFKADDQDSVSGSTGTIALSYPTLPALAIGVGESASIDWELEYHVIEGVFSYDFSDECSDFDYWTYSGFRALIFEDDRMDTLADSSTTLNMSREVDYWGFGSMIGVGFSYTFCDCFTFFATTDVSFVVGEAEWKDHQVSTGGSTSDVVITHKDDCYVIPGWHLAKGISYRACFCDMEFDLRFGGELWTWYNTPSYLVYNSEHDVAQLAGGTKRTLSFAGIFLGASFRY